MLDIPFGFPWDAARCRIRRFDLGDARAAETDKSLPTKFRSAATSGSTTFLTAIDKAIHSLEYEY
jgi:hypothetical protein